MRQAPWNSLLKALAFPLTIIVMISMLIPSLGFAIESAANGGVHTEPTSPVLLGLAVLFMAARLGGFLAKTVSQPAVLGELAAGVLLGALPSLGITGFQFLQQQEVFAIFASLGVILLLFEVGLESHLGDLLKVGLVSTAVAVLGVIAPMALGFMTSSYFLPDRSFYVHLFVGATLSATSVGITARVLKDLKRLQSREAKIILSAAVIDDVLGLIILAIVAGLIVDTSSGEPHTFSVSSMLWVGVKAVAFLVLSLFIGVKLGPVLFRLGAKMKVEGMLVSLSLSFCFILAYLANQVGLAPIVGAFAAGLVLDGKRYGALFDDGEKSIEDLIFPLSKIFVPIFFVHMGMQVDLSTLMQSSVLLLGFTLTLMACVGKMICGLVVVGKENRTVSKMIIGIGMIPRGEVGLIFAMMGASLRLNGVPVIDPSLYSSVLIMIFCTTLVTPPLLKWAYSKVVEQ
ncbi:MAG: cation:proton antiporter [Oligoflexales bacterium]|nr:cation:proton antiporter [Oligoflexales bacterium]